MRGMQAYQESIEEMFHEITMAKNLNLQPFLDQNIELYQSVPRFTEMSNG